ncbi:MAG: helix-turn-helix domain-containing protein [Clostridia bacterium]|nr:helix-turn-helix domain-containing protein [Clostridia bacterium]MDY2714384.1 helix-turn-helix domain-containing protein [Christensenellaceae bacterium]
MIEKTFYMYKISSLLTISKIVTIHYQKLLKNYVFPKEKHNFWELIYCDKNEVFVTVEDDKKLLKKGEVVFIAPNETHSVECDNLSDANIFIISFDCKSKTMNYFKGKRFIVPEDLRFLLASIMSEAKHTFVIPDFNPNLDKLVLRSDPNVGGAQVIKNNLEELLIKLIRFETAKPTSQEVFISKIEDSDALEDEIIKILENNVYSNVTLDAISSALHYGKTTICKTFKKKTGKTIIGYYLEIKIEESKKLIRENKSFSEISSALGFDSLPHFTKTFKRITTMTPREYKNSIL